MPGQSTQWISAARMLRRAGFGVTGPEVDAAVTQALWLRHRTFVADEAAAALRVTWPSEGGLAVSVVLC